MHRPPLNCSKSTGKWSWLIAGRVPRFNFMHPKPVRPGAAFPTCIAIDHFYDHRNKIFSLGEPLIYMLMAQRYWSCLLPSGKLAKSWTDYNRLHERRSFTIILDHESHVETLPSIIILNGYPFRESGEVINFRPWPTMGWMWPIWKTQMGKTFNCNGDWVKTNVTLIPHFKSSMLLKEDNGI